MEGSYVPMTSEEAAQLAEKALKNGWVEIGMNPIRHSYFYDKSNQNPIESAEQVVQIGALVLAKNPIYGSKSDRLFQSQPLPSEALQAFADIAAEYILEGKNDAEVEVALAEDFGLEVLVDHIDKILNAAREQLGRASKGSRAKTPTELFNLIEPDKEINNKLVFNMVRGMINEGVPKEKVLKKVLAKLQEKFPDLT